MKHVAHVADGLAKRIRLTRLGGFAEPEDARTFTPSPWNSWRVAFGRKEGSYVACGVQQVPSARGKSHLNTNE